MDDSIFATMMDDLQVLQLDEVTRCRYFELLSLALRCQAGGALRTKGGPLDLDLVSSRLKITPDELAGTLVVLTNAGLVGCQGDAWVVLAGTPTAAELPPAAGDVRQYWRERKQKSRSNQRQAVNQPVEDVCTPPPAVNSVSCRLEAGDANVADMSAGVEDMSTENEDMSAENEDVSAESEDMSAENEDVSAEVEDWFARYEDTSWESEEESENSEETPSMFANLSPELEFMFQSVIDMSVTYFKSSDKPPLETIARFVQQLFPELFTAITASPSTPAVSQPCSAGDIPDSLLINVLDRLPDTVKDVVPDCLPDSNFGNVLDMSTETEDMSAKIEDMSMTSPEKSVQKRVINTNINIKREELIVCMTQNLVTDFATANSPPENLHTPIFAESNFDAPQAALVGPAAPGGGPGPPARLHPAPGPLRAQSPPTCAQGLLRAAGFDLSQIVLAEPAVPGGSPSPSRLDRSPLKPPDRHNTAVQAQRLPPAADAGLSGQDSVQALHRLFPGVKISAVQENGLRLMGRYYGDARLVEIFRREAEKGVDAATALKHLPNYLSRLDRSGNQVFMPA